MRLKAPRRRGSISAALRGVKQATTGATQFSDGIILGTMAFLSTALDRVSHSFLGWRMVGLMLPPRAVGTGIFIVGSTLFVIPLEQSLGIQRSVTSLLFALSGLVGGVTAPLSGALMDRVGPRRVLLGSVVVMAVGYGLFAVSPNVAFLFAVFMLPIGLTSLNVAYNGSSGLVNNWFERYKATAMSALQVGSGLGVLLLVPALALTIETWGWRIAAVAAGAAVLLIGFPATWFSRDTPEEMGLLPDGAPAADLGSPPAGEGTGQSARAALRTPAFWVMTAAGVCFGGALSGMTIHFVPVLVWKGMDPVTGALVLTMSAAVGMPLALVAGPLADRFGPLNVAAVVSLVAGAGIAVINVAQQEWAIWGGALLFSVYFSLYSLLWAALGRTFGRRAYSTIRGYMMAGQIGGTTGVPVLAGVLFDRSGSYALTLWLIVGLWAASALLLALAARQRPTA